jgi:hypothetical protein
MKMEHNYLLLELLSCEDPFISTLIEEIIELNISYPPYGEQQILPGSYIPSFNSSQFSKTSWSIL